MKNSRGIALIVLMGLFLGSYCTVSHAPNNGKDVIKAMHEAYNSEWYPYLTFTQITRFFDEEGIEQHSQTWYEAMEVPGKLAIKFDSRESGDGVLFRDGKQYTFKDSLKAEEVERVHNLLVLGFDVFKQSPDTTIKILSDEFDLNAMYSDSWKGKDVYVVGVNEPDTTIPQFWIDKEHLYFVKEYISCKDCAILEVQFNDYRKLEKGWVAAEVVYKKDGIIRTHEKYIDIELPDSINSAIFDPMKFAEAKW